MTLRTGRTILPRVLAFDLDGTLLRSDDSLSPRTKAALDAVRTRGVETVFVTGRPPRWVDHLVEDVGDHGVVLCSNGAFTYDVRQAQVRQCVGLQPAEVAALVADIRRVLPEAAFAAEMGLLVRRDPAYLLKAGRGTGASSSRSETVGPVERVRQPVGKLLVRVDRDVAEVPGAHGPVALAQVAQVVREAVGVRAEVVTSGYPYLIEIGPPGVTKASALASFCAERRIRPKDVWAFGDEINDLAMLQWAGRSFAVGNAHPEVLAVATDVARGPAEDGVAQVLERVLDEGAGI